MRRILATAALGALLVAAPALAEAGPAPIPVVDASCPAASASTLRGMLLRSSPDSLTMTVDGGTGPLLAFGAAHLMLPIAPNATVVGSPRRGDTVLVRAIACPNADKTAITMVAGRVEVKARRAGKKVAPRKTVAAEPKR